MKEIIPYKTVSGALKALDNGGRLYNIFTRAGDGTITDSELYKAAGVIAGQDKALLYFSLALARLNTGQQKTILSHLSQDLRSQYSESKPESIQIGRFEKDVETKQAVVLEGYPKFLEDKTKFSAFIMIPISTGNVTTFTMIPIYDQFDVYELYVDSSLKGPRALIATPKSKKHLAPVGTTIGGIVKELNFKTKAKKNPDNYYVESLYYTKHSR